MYGFTGLYGSAYGQRPVTAGMLRAGVTEQQIRPPSAVPEWVRKKLPTVESPAEGDGEAPPEGEGEGEGEGEVDTEGPDLTRLIVGGLIAAGLAGGAYYLFFRKK